MVKLRPNETIDSLIRRFKKETIKSGIIQDVRKHEYYIAPGEKKRMKKAAAQKRAAKKKAKSTKNY